MAGSRRAADAHRRALERRLLVPAPDLAPLAEKPVLSEVEGLALARRHQAWELPPSGDALMGALEDDALRLSRRP